MSSIFIDFTHLVSFIQKDLFQLYNYLKMKKKRVVKTKKQNFGGGTKKIKGGGLEDLDLMNQNPKTNKVAKKK